MSEDKSLSTLVSELWELTLRYAKQETVDPLKSLVRFLAWGVPGAIFLGVGLVLLLVGGMRAMQLELSPHLNGHWSWVPYLAVLVVALIFAGLLVRAILAEKRRTDRERAKLRLEKARV